MEKVRIKIPYLFNGRVLDFGSLRDIRLFFEKKSGIKIADISWQDEDTQIKFGTTGCNLFFKKASDASYFVLKIDKEFIEGK